MQRAAWVWIGALAASALALFALGELTYVDRTLADAMFDWSTRRFVWQDNEWVAQWLHRSARHLMIAIGSIAVVLAVFDRVRPIARWSSQRRWAWRVVACTAVLLPIVVAAVKSQSAEHCPWSVDRYGGTHQQITLMQPIPDGFVRGKCFPAGHATSALWLVALGAFWWPINASASHPVVEFAWRRRKRYALLVAALGAGIGVALGVVQQARGAHFLTHTLWSLWFACAITVAMGALLRPRSETLQKR
jgi:membrane-associated PAP2 superfamily phosphatase